MSQLHRITIDPDRYGGKPCIRALDIRVQDILDQLASGASREQILAEYLYLEPEDITAVLEYAAARKATR